MCQKRRPLSTNGCPPTFCLGCLARDWPLGRPVLPSKKRCFNEIKISIFDGHLSYIYINVSKTATTLERNGGISFFGFGALGALRGVCLSGGPFYLVKNGVSCKSRFRSSMIIWFILSIFDLGQVRTGIFLLFSSLWPQSYPSQGRGQIFCTRLLLYLGIRGLSECHHSHTFRPSNMNCNFGDPYGTFGPWGAAYPTVHSEFAIACIFFVGPDFGLPARPPPFCFGGHKSVVVLLENSTRLTDVLRRLHIDEKKCCSVARK